MKRLTMFIFMTMGCILLFGQEATNTPPKASLSKRNSLAGLSIDSLNKYREKAVSKRNTGGILSMVGVSLTAGGIWLWTETATLNFNESKGTEIPLLMMMTGLITTFVGVPKLIIGGNRMHKAEIAIKTFNQKTTYTTAVGIGLKVRF